MAKAEDRAEGTSKRKASTVQDRECDRTKERAEQGKIECRVENRTEGRAEWLERQEKTSTWRMDKQRACRRAEQVL